MRQPTVAALGGRLTWVSGRDAKGSLAWSKHMHVYVYNYI